MCQEFQAEEVPPLCPWSPQMGISQAAACAGKPGRKPHCHEKGGSSVPHNFFAVPCRRSRERPEWELDDRARVRVVFGAVSKHHVVSPFRLHEWRARTAQTRLSLLIIPSELSKAAVTSRRTILTKHSAYDNSRHRPTEGSSRHYIRQFSVEFWRQGNGSQGRLSRAAFVSVMESAHFRKLHR
jgi:hypothetical protein